MAGKVVSKVARTMIGSDMSDIEDITTEYDLARG